MAITIPSPGSSAAPSPETTLMHGEAGEAGTVLARLLARNRPALAALGQRLRTAPPGLAVTCARGSSDHAATYAKYLIETLTGTPTLSAAFSTVSLYHAGPAPAADLAAAPLCLAISQSGRSPDLLETVRSHRAAGALTVSLVNDETAPLAELADVTLPLCAGPERSVAATKSFIASMGAVAALVAEWTGDDALARDLAALPAALDASFVLDWSAALPMLAGAESLYVISRGYGLAIAQEAALKLKETCGLHGEAFSSAEVRHGPMAIVRDGFPVLAFDIGGPAGDDVRAVSAEFTARGAQVWLATARPEGLPPGIGLLPALPARAELAPLLQIASFYRLVNAVAVARGMDPDCPPFLAKVTRTR